MSIAAELAGLGPRDLVAVVREAFGRLVEAPLWQLADEDTLVLVRELTAAVAQGEAARLAAVREVDARGAAVVTGASSTTAWLTGVLLERPGAAKRAVVVAKGLAERYTATSAALAAGDISADHAQVICRVLDGLQSTIPVGEVLKAERTLLDHAAGYDPLTLAKLGRHLAYVLDPDGEKALAAHEARLEAGRELFLSQYDDGYWDLRARLDPVAGAELWTILDSLSAPKPSTEHGPDPRTAPQRRADALVQVCELLLEAGNLPTQGGERPTLVITSTLDSLQERLGAAAASLPNGCPLSAGQLRQIACDAKVIPIVMGGESQPLDIGRSRYAIPPYLRRAMLIRDGHRCVIPGCVATPRIGHHILPWHHLGETKLDNIASLCGYHHRWIHAGRGHLITSVEGGSPLVDMVTRGPAP